jgi:hypothetical protein
MAANLAAVTANLVAAVRKIEEITVPAAEAIVAGQVCRLDVSTGKATLAKATDAAESRARGIALNSAAAGLPVTLLVKGIVDVGNVLGGLDYDADVYLSDTDGLLRDATGTVAKIVGTVTPGFGNTTADKLLRIDL